MCVVYRVSMLLWNKYHARQRLSESRDNKFNEWEHLRERGLMGERTDEQTDGRDTDVHARETISLRCRDPEAGRAARR